MYFPSSIAIRPIQLRHKRTLGSEFPFIYQVSSVDCLNDRALGLRWILGKRSGLETEEAKMKTVTHNPRSRRISVHFVFHFYTETEVHHVNGVKNCLVTKISYFRWLTNALGENLRNSFMVSFNLTPALEATDEPGLRQKTAKGKHSVRPRMNTKESLPRWGGEVRRSCFKLQNSKTDYYP